VGERAVTWILLAGLTLAAVAAVDWLSYTSFLLLGVL